MAYALVGSLGTVATGTGSASPTYAQATTAGNLLVLWVMGFGVSGGSVDQGFTEAVNILNANGKTAVFYKANCGASETAPVWTYTGGTDCAARLGEFSGGETSSPVDTTGSASGTTSPVTVTTGSSLATTGELIISASGSFLSKAGTDTTSDTYNNGASPTGSASNDGTSTANHYRFAYGITSSGTSAETNSVTSASMNLTFIKGVIAAFKVPSIPPGIVVERTNFIYLRKNR